MPPLRVSMKRERKMRNSDVQRIIENLERSLLESSEKKILESQEEKFEFHWEAPENKKLEKRV